MGGEWSQERLHPPPKGVRCGRETMREWERGIKDRHKLRGNFTILPSFLSCPMDGGLYSTRFDQDSTKSQMGVVTPTYPTLSHLYKCTQKAKCACVHTISHTHTLTFHATHYTLTSRTPIRVTNLESTCLCDTYSYLCYQQYKRCFPDLVNIGSRVVR